MYVPVSSKTIKYHLDDCGIEIRQVKEFLSANDSMYNIILDRPGDSVFIGLTSIEESKEAILFANPILSFANRNKSIPDQMGYLEVIVRAFVRYADLRNRVVLTIITDNNLLAEVMVDLDFSLIPQTWKSNGKYKGIMALVDKHPLPF